MKPSSAMNPPFRILRILTRMNIGGPSVHVSILSRGLDASRFATHLISGTPDNSEGDLTAMLDGAPIALTRLSSLARPIRPIADLRSLFSILGICWRERPAIIHTHMAKAGMIGRLSGWLYNRLGPGRRPGRRARLIHTFHGHVLDGYFHAWAAAVFVTMERWLARRTDVLIAVSESVRDALIAKGIGSPGQWRVIPLGLDLEPLARLPQPKVSQGFRVGMIGRLVPIKNPSLFVQALRATRNMAVGPTTGVIVGDGPLRQSLEREAETLGLEPAVSFLGWQSDLQQVYGNLDAVCLTSWNEGTPVALIEAMAAGRVVVATAVGGVPDLLEDSGRRREPPTIGDFRITNRGILVQAGDAGGLSAALNRLAGDPDLRERLGQAAKTHVLRTHGKERLIADITALYENLLRSEERE